MTALLPLFPKKRTGYLLATMFQDAANIAAIRGT
jgi:hypothetical protein